jgi:hypothetical protein
VAAQAEARRHWPLWQFLEQQSAPRVQLSPRVLQVAPGTEAHAPWSQVPEQQSEPALHGAPICRQTLVAQVPAWQTSEQQSVGFEQGEPGAEQRTSSPQVGAPPSRGRQRPEQHAGDCPGVHGLGAVRHWAVEAPSPASSPASSGEPSGASAQNPLEQKPLVQSESVEQVPPAVALPQ